MPWPFDREYMQLALAAGAVIGVSAPLIGTFLVSRRMSLIGDGIGHIAFAGVAGGLLIGIWPVWSALLFAVVAAIAMERIRQNTSGDVALALIFYTGLAAGIVLVGLSGSLNAGIFSYLFGSILTVTRAELLAIAAMGIVVISVVLLTRHALFAVSTDDEWAAVAGLRVRLLSSGLSVLAALTIVAAMRIVGLLLVAALMVLPVAAAQLYAKTFAKSMKLSAALGVASVVVGLAAARAGNLAPGGTIVLTAALAYALVAVAANLKRVA